MFTSSVEECRSRIREDTCDSAFSEIIYTSGKCFKSIHILKEPFMFFCFCFKSQLLFTAGAAGGLLIMICFQTKFLAKT